MPPPSSVRNFRAQLVLTPYHVTSTGNDIAVGSMASTTAKAQPGKIPSKVAAKVPTADSYKKARVPYERGIIVGISLLSTNLDFSMSN
jgi:hypothetical protein